jgi:hypothetical protein
LTSANWLKIKIDRLNPITAKHFGQPLRIPFSLLVSFHSRLGLKDALEQKA